jgi:hypothetical protein
MYSRRVWTAIIPASSLTVDSFPKRTGQRTEDNRLESVNGYISVGIPCTLWAILDVRNKRVTSRRGQLCANFFIFLLTFFIFASSAGGCSNALWYAWNLKQFLSNKGLAMPASLSQIYPFPCGLLFTEHRTPKYDQKSEMYREQQIRQQRVLDIFHPLKQEGQQCSEIEH